MCSSGAQGLNGGPLQFLKSILFWWRTTHFVVYPSYSHLELLICTERIENWSIFLIDFYSKDCQKDWPLYQYDVSLFDLVPHSWGFLWHLKVQTEVSTVPYEHNWLTTCVGMASNYPYQRKSLFCLRFYSLWPARMLGRPILCLSFASVAFLDQNAFLFHSLCPSPNFLMCHHIHKVFSKYFITNPSSCPWNSDDT